MKQTYTLEDRTLKLAEAVIALCRTIPKDILNNPIVSQLIRSATSVGANYREANGASSKKDFKNKIFICKKEAKETQYWLQLLVKSYPPCRERCRIIWKEAHELTLIFSKIATNTK